MRKHKECLIRLVKAFYIMLDFYGMYFDEYIIILFRNDHIVKRTKKYRKI